MLPYSQTIHFYPRKKGPMLKEMNYQKKFELIQPWFPLIVEAVKKDIRQEHLQKDRLFTKTHFGNKPVQRITTQELIQVYDKLIKEGQENIAEFIAIRWLLKHSDLYNYFEGALSKISPDFDQLEQLDEASGDLLLNDALNEFGATKTYLFTIFNSVVFQDKHLEALKEKATSELSFEEIEKAKNHENASLEELKKLHAIDLQRVIDKYEKKLTGLQKKYIQDTENLKKQVSGLQRKLQSY